MKKLSHTAAGKLFKDNPGAWGIYVACVYNPDRNKQLAALATDEQREKLRDAYEEDRCKPTK